MSASRRAAPAHGPRRGRHWPPRSSRAGFRGGSLPGEAPAPTTLPEAGPPIGSSASSASSAVWASEARSAPVAASASIILPTGRSVPRPRGSTALSAASGGSRRGFRATCSNRSGDPRPRPGREAAHLPHRRRGPSRSSDRPAAGCPAGGRTMASTPTPSPSRPARMEPADVPTQTSTCRQSNPSASCSARSAPTIQANPSTPPAPSASPRRTRTGTAGEAGRRAGSASPSASELSPVPPARPGEPPCAPVTAPSPPTR